MIWLISWLLYSTKPRATSWPARGCPRRDVELTFAIKNSDIGVGVELALHLHDTYTRLITRNSEVEGREREKKKDQQQRVTIS